MTTVGELINLLQRFPDDAVVIMSEDPDGNRFSILSEISEGVWEPDPNYLTDGELWVARELTPELSAQGYSNEDVYDGDDAKDCIVLWPAI